MKYSFVVPIFNDGALADSFAKELGAVFTKHLEKSQIENDVELIFVDDGSSNDSVAKLREAQKKYPFVKVLVLSRNFGQHIAISAGYKFASGKFAGMLNVDQEDPPDQLPVLLKPLESGEFDIVNGLYEHRNVPLLAKVTSYGFNVMLNRLTGYVTPTQSSTARVMNRAFLDAYNALEERARFIPGLENWLGFRHGFVSVRHQPRKAGRSSYNLRRRYRMAVDSIISFSDFPLRMAVRFGFLIAFAGVAFIALLVIERLVGVDRLPGWTSTVAAVLLIGGVQIFVTGIASLYIGRILAEVQRRPLFLVRDALGFHENKETIAIAALEEPQKSRVEIAEPVEEIAARNENGS